MRFLVDYSWPGNVRELENVIERSLVLATDATITPDQLPEHVRASRAELPPTDGDLSIKRKTGELEQSLIRRALERTQGNRTRAAQLLQLSHRALLYKIREYGL